MGTLTLKIVFPCCHRRTFNRLFVRFSLSYIIGFRILTPSVSLKPLKPACQQITTVVTLKFLGDRKKTFNVEACAVQSVEGNNKRSRAWSGIVSLLPVIHHLWWIRDDGVRVTRSGVRWGEAVPEKTPASLVTATDTILTFITPSLLFQSVYSLFPRYLCPLSYSHSFTFSLLAEHFFKIQFYFFLRLWSVARGMPLTPRVSYQESTPSSCHTRWVFCVCLSERLMHRPDNLIGTNVSSVSRSTWSSYNAVDTLMYS